MTKSGTRGFYFLNATQFLGAFNDNILKQLLVFGLAAGGVWGNQLGEGGQAWAQICLAIPFVLLSGFASQFSDKYSKRRVSIMAKWTEIPIALFAMIGLWLGSLSIVMAALFLIALQSTFFSPAKFGILPEIVPDEKLSQANGTVNMFTWFAIILGIALSGPIYDGYSGDTSTFSGHQVAMSINRMESPSNVLIATPKGDKDSEFVRKIEANLAERHRVVGVVESGPQSVRPALDQANASGHPVNVIACTQESAKWEPVVQSKADIVQPIRLLWLPGVVLLVVGALGTLCSHGISVVPAQNPKREISYWIFESYQKTWSHFRGTTAMTALFAYAFFFMIVAGIAASVVVEYKVILEIDATQTTYLFFVLAALMGVGDYTAGVISRGRIRPELLNFGNTGVAVAFLALAFIPANFYLVALLLGVGGFMAGFVMVPLQTMVQYLAGDEQRGQFLGFWNCVSFTGLIIGAGLFMLMLQIEISFFGLSESRAATNVWVLCSLLTVVFQLLYFFRWRRPFAKAVDGVEVEGH